ncbi:hypothetical protein MHBO_000134 [Bonamia ostreae]|uniref:Cullin family profile domain-containing protein n=1 Tax=Bonamia ostreae TaxID=126728 RepID=A0ABV2AEK2_9EUKA
MKAAIDRNVDKCVGFLIKFVEESIAREDAAQTIGEMVPLFRLLSHKSEFEFAYSASLAFRLMGAPAESPRASEVERRVLGVLKAECGANYVARLNDMLDEFFCKPSQQVFGVKSFLRLKVFGRKIWPACSDAAVDVGSVLPQLAEQIVFSKI